MIAKSWQNKAKIRDDLYAGSACAERRAWDLHDMLCHHLRRTDAAEA